MHITMRLYKRHDLDLLAIYKQKDVSFTQLIKKAVLAYLDGKTEQISYPATNISLSDMPSTLQIKVYFSKSNVDDMRVYDYVGQLAKGFRNSALKNITRYYLSSPTTFEILNNNIAFSTERTLNHD